MTDRLLVAYGLMVLLAVAAGAAIWWTVHYSPRRVYDRRIARERKEARASASRREPIAEKGDHA